MGGYMDPKLRVEDSEKIMQVGRWKSLVYLMYKRTKIGSPYKDMLAKMATEIIFQHLG